MFCCCPQESNTYTVEETQKSPRDQSNNKSRAVSTSNQTTSGGASLNNSATTPDTYKKSPVIEQPATIISTSKDQLQSQKNLTTSRAEKTAEIKPHSVEVSDIQVKVTEPESLNKAAVKPGAEIGVKFEPVSTLPIEKHLSSSSESVTVDPKASISNIMNNEQVKSVNTELDKLDKAISEAEASPHAESRSSINKLANQLKSLNSQVLATAAGTGKMAEKAIEAVVTRLESVAARLEALAARSEGAQHAGGHSAPADSGVVAPLVQAYDDILSSSLAQFLTLSNNIGGEVKIQSALVKEAFDAQRNFLVIVSKSREPDQATFGELLKHSSNTLQAVQNYRENNRKSENFNHLSAISESIAALVWITIAPAPGPYVKEMIDSGTFFTNRVLKDHKQEPKHVDWCRSWIQLLTELQAYIKQYHTTGLSWNAKGGDAKSAQAATSPAAANIKSPPAAGHGAPPPPPPPGPPPPPVAKAADNDDDGTSRSALFAEIAKGEDVTKGLKRVTDDMKTHKNPALRQGQAPIKAAPASKPTLSPKPGTKAQVAVTHPPVTELQGKKWVVEYHKGNKNIVLNEVDLKHSVYIYKCDDCVITVSGKINSIVVDSCKKTGIVFDDLLSSLEFVNCQSMQGQVTGKLPTLSIDKTDGCMIYLSAKSLDVEIVSAKSSEMNILIPDGSGDFKEFALPEQFKTTYNGKTVVTVPTDIV
uniref:Adenylyl cyclase-associated protein n=2 Tax=Arion vulgaris TaxID=1028688 RepID=A0A0B7AU63_9EUPU